MSSEVIRVVVPLTGAESLLETVQLLGPAQSEINLYFYFDLWCSRYGPELERRRSLGKVI